MLLFPPLPRLPTVCAQIDNDSRHNDAVRAELQARLAKLTEALWDEVDKREVAASKHITALAADSWVNDSQQAIAARIAKLAQLEVRKGGSVHKGM